MLLNESLFEEYINYNPDDISNDTIDAQQEDNNNIELQEDFSKYLPSWLTKNKDIINMLNKRGIDLANVEFIGAEIPESGHNPDIKNPNLLKVYHLKYGSEKYPSYEIYIPGYNDARQVDLLNNGKWIALKYYSAKQLLAHTIDFGYIDLTNASNMNSGKRKERYDAKKNALELDREKNAQYPYEPVIGYEPKENGDIFSRDYDKPIYGDLQWLTKSGYDKSGYLLKPDKYKNLLVKLQAENSQKALDDCYAKIEEVRSMILELMPKIDLKSKEGYNAFRSISNASSTLSNLIYSYNEYLEEISWYNDHKSAYNMGEEDLKKEISRIIQKLIKETNSRIESIKSELNHIKLPETNNISDKDEDKKITESFTSNNNEAMAKLAKKHQLDILSPMQDGDFRVSGTVRDIDSFYKEAKKLNLLPPEDNDNDEGEEITESVLAGALLTGLGTSIGGTLVSAIKDLFTKDPSKKKSKWIDFKGYLIEKTPQGEIFVYDNKSNNLGTGIDFHTVKQAKQFIQELETSNTNNDKVEQEISEALHGKEEIDEFTQLAKRLGFISIAQMQHIMNAAKSLGKSELEMLKSIDKTFDGKVPDDLIDGLTDTFLTVANEIGIETDDDYHRFIEEEVEPGETITQAILRYKQELEDLGIDSKNYTENLNESAMLNIDKEAVFNEIANAKEYIEENKFIQAKDSLTQAANLITNPLQESAMSRLDLEIKYLNQDIKELNSKLKNLNYQLKMAGNGGEFDNSDISNLENDIEETIKELKEKEDKLASIKV